MYFSNVHNLLKVYLLDKTASMFASYEHFFIFLAYAEEEGELESCIMNRKQYYWPSSTFNSISGIVPCENCSR